MAEKRASVGPVQFNKLAALLNSKAIYGICVNGSVIIVSVLLLQFLKMSCNFNALLALLAVMNVKCQQVTVAVFR